MLKIYLAIPYSYNPAQSFAIANKVAAKLMSEGHLVYSPISHSHHIADHLPGHLRTDSHWWMQHDLPMIDWADELHVVLIGEMGDLLIAESVGVTLEIKHAQQTGKNIKFIEHYE